jgi:hypothetical protein
MADISNGNQKDLEYNIPQVSDEKPTSTSVSSGSNRESSIEDYRRRFTTSIDKRIRDVEDNIYGNQGLLKDYECKLLSESDPRELMKIKQTICQVKEFLDSCRDEYIGLIKYIGYVQTDLLSNVVQDSKNEKSITRRTHGPKPD